MIYPDELQQYLDDGWMIGENYKPTLNTVIVTKPGMPERHIYPDELQQYLNRGWVRGGKSRNKNKKSFAKNLIWINKDSVQKRISIDELQQYLDDGWVRGTCQKRNTGMIHITDGVSDMLIKPEELSIYVKQGWKKGSISKTSRGTYWVHKGGVLVHVKTISELESYIDDGWIRGTGNLIKPSRTTKGLISVTKSNKTIMIDPSLLQQYLDDGWVKGNPNKKSNSRTGRVLVNKQDVVKSICYGELNKYLDDGWVLGGKKSKVKRCRIVKDDVEKFIKLDELDKYIEQGWNRGCITRKTTKNSPTKP